MRRGGVVALAGASVVALLLGGGTAAMSMNSPDPVSPDGDLNAAAYAEEHGVTPEQARERLGQQGELAEYLDVVGELAGTSIVWAGIVHDDYFGIRVLVDSEAAREDVHEYLARTGVEYAVELSTQPTAEKGDAIVEAFGEGWLEQFPGVDGIYYDGRTGLIHVDYSGDRADELRARIAEDERITIPVQIDQNDTPAGDARVGGLIASIPAGNCTMGFSIVASTGGYRTTTAGHCGNSGWRYVAASGSHSNPITFTGELRSSRADVQWGTTGLTPLPEFHGDSMSIRRPVQSVVSRTGLSGGYSCHRG